MTRLHIGAILLSTASLIGCRPSEFDDLEDRAPIRVYEAPEDFQGTQYGRVVAAYSGELADGTLASRVMASGGKDSSFAVLPVWNGGLDLGSEVMQGCNLGECMSFSGEGTALAGLPTFVSPSNLMEQHMCVLVPLPPTQEPKVLCETRPGVFEGVGTGLTNIGLGESAVGLGLANPVGLAVLGAPRAAMGRGGAFLLDGDGADALIEPTDEVDLTAASLSSSAQAGASLDALRIDATRTWLAIGAPGMQRVVVVELERTASDVTTTTVLGCFDDADPMADGFGAGVALGDVTGDGIPDLAVATDTAALAATVPVYSGAGLGGAVGCVSPDASDDASAPIEVTCDGPLDGLREARCESSAFGKSVTMGDLDADGVDELIVGAPAATVDGILSAGAVYVVPFDAGVPSPDGAVALVHSNPEEGDELGWSLATVETNLEDEPRDEVVAGMPGTDAVAIFLCSNLDGDGPGQGQRCIPGS